MELKTKIAYKFWPITALPSGFSNGSFIKDTSESITNWKYLTVSSTFAEGPNQTDMKKLSSHALARRQKMVRYTRHTGSQNTQIENSKFFLFNQSTQDMAFFDASSKVFFSDICKDLRGNCAQHVGSIW